MTCKTCGYPAENVNGQRVPQGHNYGCARASAMLAPDPAYRSEVAAVELSETEGDSCEHGECPNPKRPQGKGPKPKYCDDHSTPKSRKE